MYDLAFISGGGVEVNEVTQSANVANHTERKRAASITIVFLCYDTLAFASHLSWVFCSPPVFVSPEWSQIFGADSQVWHIPVIVPGHQTGTWVTVSAGRQHRRISHRKRSSILCFAARRKIPLCFVPVSRCPGERVNVRLRMWSLAASLDSSNLDRLSPFPMCTITWWEVHANADFSDCLHVLHLRTTNVSLWLFSVWLREWERLNHQSGWWTDGLKPAPPDSHAITFCVVGIKWQFPRNSVAPVTPRYLSSFEPKAQLDHNPAPDQTL